MTDGSASPQLLAPDHPYWEKCARHRNKQTSRFVAHLFLCDACAQRLKRECFNDRPPIFEGLAVEGFCGLCNYAPPTRHSVAAGMWWTDCFTLHEHLRTIRARRGEEDKSAGYYSPQAFRTIGSFRNELFTRGYVTLQKRLKKQTLPLR